MWPEGAPEWLELAQALWGCRTTPRRRPRPVPPTRRCPSRRRSAPRPCLRCGCPRSTARRRLRIAPGARPAGSGASPSATRTALLALVGVAVVVGVLAGLWAVLRPYLAKRRAIAEVQRYALAERRVEDPEAGLLVELPPGWVALRPENPFVQQRGARLRLAQPAAGVFGAVSMAVRPRFMDDLDGYLDEVLQARLPRRPRRRSWSGPTSSSAAGAAVSSAPPGRTASPRCRARPWPGPTATTSSRSRRGRPSRRGTPSGPSWRPCAAGSPRRARPAARIARRSSACPSRCRNFRRTPCVCS